MRSLSHRVTAVLVLIMLFIAVLAPASSLSVQADPPPAREEVMVVKVYYSSDTEREKLAVLFGADDHVATTGGYVTVWTNRARYEEIMQSGYKAELDTEATTLANQPITWNTSNQDTFFNGYRTVEDMQAFLDLKVSQYPSLAEKQDIGDSWCKTHAPCVLNNAPAQNWNGYDLWVMHITNRSIPGTKPVFWFDAGIHSRELATSELAMRFIDYLLTNYNTNADVHWLVDYHDIYVMPMVNPDGHHLVEAGGSSPYLHRKNSDKDDGCSTWPTNSGSQLGVDLNRNFPFQWACCGGGSNSPCDETYRGPAINSEEEVQAVVNKVRAVVPDQRGPNLTDAAPLTTNGILQTLHSYSSLNLYPWGFTTTAAPNSGDLANIGKHMSAANASPAGNAYTACQPAVCLYVADGATDDWAYGELGIPAYTTELEGTTFTPSFTSVDGIWNNNRGMLLHLARSARTPYLLTHGPDTKLVAASPLTVTAGTAIQLSATINYVWTSNAYAQNVGAAEYYIDTPPWAGGTPLAMTPTDGTLNSQTEAVQATLNTSSLSAGRHILFVRGRGVNNYSTYQTWGQVSAIFVWVNAGGPTPTFTPTVTPGGPTPTFTPTATPVSVTNDDFNGATTIGALPYTGNATTTSYTTATDDPALCAGTPATGAHSVWFKYTPGTNNTLALDTFTSGYDTVLAVFTGARGSLTRLACNDDAASGTQSQITGLAVTAGTTYYIEIAAYGSGAGGATVLHVSGTTTVTNTPTSTPVVITNTPTRTPSPTPVVITNTPTPTATGIACPNLGGTYCRTNNEARTWIAGSTATGITGDDQAAAVTLPFAFNFMGTSYTSINISSNGNAHFGTSSTAYSNVAVPGTGAPNAMIAAFWDDLDPAAGGAIYTAVSGTAPNRTFTIEWRDVRAYNTGTSGITFEIQLVETSNHIWVLYQDTVFGSTTIDAGLSATSGIENSGGTAGNQYSFNSAALANGLVLHYWKP